MPDAVCGAACPGAPQHLGPSRMHARPAAPPTQVANNADSEGVCPGPPQRPEAQLLAPAVLIVAWGREKGQAAAARQGSGPGHAWHAARQSWVQGGRGAGTWAQTDRSVVQQGAFKQQRSHLQARALALRVRRPTGSVVVTSVGLQVTEQHVVQNGRLVRAVARLCRGAVPGGAGWCVCVSRRGVQGGVGGEGGSSKRQLRGSGSASLSSGASPQQCQPGRDQGTLPASQLLVFPLYYLIPAAFPRAPRPCSPGP